MKTMIRAITAILLIGVFAAISGCDLVGILGATPEIITEDYFSSVWNVKVRATGAAGSAVAWSSVILNDSDGTVIHRIGINGTAYFDLPGDGSYEVAAYDISGNKLVCATGPAIVAKSITEYDCTIHVSADGTVNID